MKIVRQLTEQNKDQRGPVTYEMDNGVACTAEKLFQQTDRAQMLVIAFHLQQRYMKSNENVQHLRAIQHQQSKDLSKQQQQHYPEMFVRSLWSYMDEKQYGNAVDLYCALLKQQQQQLVSAGKSPRNPPEQLLRRFLVDFLSGEIDHALTVKFMRMILLIAQVNGLQQLAAMWSTSLQRDFATEDQDDDFDLVNVHKDDYPVQLMDLLNWLLNDSRTKCGVLLRTLLELLNVDVLLRLDECQLVLELAVECDWKNLLSSMLKRALKMQSSDHSFVCSVLKPFVTMSYHQLISISDLVQLFCDLLSPQQYKLLAVMDNDLGYFSVCAMDRLMQDYLMSNVDSSNHDRKLLRSAPTVDRLRKFWCKRPEIAAFEHIMTFLPVMYDLLCEDEVSSVVQIGNRTQIDQIRSDVLTFVDQVIQKGPRDQQDAARYFKDSLDS